MIKPTFSIHARYKQLIPSEKEAISECKKIWGQFSENMYLKMLYGSFESVIAEIEDEADRLAKDKEEKEKPLKFTKEDIVSEEMFDNLSKYWELILCYFALMDNQQSPFQVFKEDNSEKTQAVSSSLSIPQEVLEMIEYINTDPSAIIYNVLLNSIRIPYMRVVCSNEWQTILDIQQLIHSNQIVARSANIGIRPDNIASVQRQKSELLTENGHKRRELTERLAALYGEKTQMITEAERHLSIETAFATHSLKKNDNINKGQNR